jgi:hypothetical protein
MSSTDFGVQRSRVLETEIKMVSALKWYIFTWYMPTNVLRSVCTDDPVFGMCMLGDLTETIEVAISKTGKYSIPMYRVWPQSVNLLQGS